MKRMDLSISEILSLETIVPYMDSTWFDLHIFEKLFDIDVYSINNDLARERISIINKMVSNESDCRLRTLNILYFDGHPCLVYQEVGKGECYENVFTFDHNLLFDCISFLKVLSIEDSYLKVPIAYADTVVSVSAYGMDLKIENNKLIPYYE